LEQMSEQRRTEKFCGLSAGDIMLRRAGSLGSTAGRMPAATDFKHTPCWLEMVEHSQAHSSRQRLRDGVRDSFSAGAGRIRRARSRLWLRRPNGEPQWRAAIHAFEFLDKMRRVNEAQVKRDLLHLLARSDATGRLMK